MLPGRGQSAVAQGFAGQGGGTLVAAISGETSAERLSRHKPTPPAGSEVMRYSMTLELKAVLCRNNQIPSIR